MKKFLFYVFSLCVIVSCNSGRPVIEGTITEIDILNSAYPSFTIEDVLAAGFDYGDVVQVQFEDGKSHLMPITTAYTEVGTGAPCFCHYSKKFPVCFGLCCGNFVARYGVKVGDRVRITMHEKQGFAEMHELLYSVYSNDRTDYPGLTDEQFANFREITTTGMKPTTIYRSGNPLNFKSNKVRCAYVDSLACVYGIKSELDIADTDSDVRKYAGQEGFVSKYCYDLFLKGKTVTMGVSPDMFGDESRTKYALCVRHMLKTQPPYLIHCNEGKDRCGFCCILLESLAGATLEDVRNDYMTTFYNLYGMEKGTKRYEMNLKVNGDRLIYLMAHPDDIKKTDFDWDSVDVTAINLQSSAEKFLTANCGLSADEVKALKKIICK